MAGEYLVAGELNNRSIQASITFGKSKSTDIYAFVPSGHSIARVEVKCTDKNKWLIGTKLLDKSNCADNCFWVFVYLPKPHENEHEVMTDQSRGKICPRYFILTSLEAHEIANDNYKQYRQKYFKRHGKEFSEEGVESMTQRDISMYENEWHKISYFIFRQRMSERLNRKR